MSAICADVRALRSDAGVQERRVWKPLDGGEAVVQDRHAEIGEEKTPAPCRGIGLVLERPDIVDVDAGLGAGYF